MRLSLSNWSVSTRLVAVFAVASVTGLVFGGLRISDAMGSAAAYGRTAQLAVLGEQVTALAQAMEDERDIYAGYAAYSTLAADATTNKAAPSVTGPIKAKLAQENAFLHAAETNTTAIAKRTGTLAAAIGSAFPATLQAEAQNVVELTKGFTVLRTSLAAGSAGDVIQGYSNEIANLFVLNDEITNGSPDPVLADDVLALGALSRAKDQASQMRAILYSALIEASVNDAGGGTVAPHNTIGAQSIEDAGGVSALTTAQELQLTDLQNFDNTATPALSNAYTTTVANQTDDYVNVIENFVAQNGDPRLVFEQVNGQDSLGYNQASVAKTWYTYATTQVIQIRSVESQLVATIVARSQTLQGQAFDSAVLTAVVTVAAALLVLLATAIVGRTLVNPLRRLQADALEIAAVQLPARVAAAAAGTETSAGPPTIEPIGVQSTDEIGRVARAFDQVHAEAVRLAGNEAQLRGSLNAMFISLSRRSVPLIDRLARMIDAMEQNEDDPDQLADLFAMDHLITRMRRNSENLLVLAGEEPVRKWTESVPLTDVARAATSEIEQYNRVALAVQPGIMISGQAAADVVHLLAELIENATMFSPQSTQIRVTVMELASGGVLVEVRDDGVGVSPSRLADMNWRLDHPPVVDVSISRHMGLYAVSRLAARHGIRVKLRPGTPQGLSALVWLPGQLAKHEQVPPAGSHSRPFGTSTNPGAGFRPAAAAKRVTGRHRSALRNTSGEQPVLAGQGARDGRPATVWFAAKRPSGAARPTEELAGDWRPATNGRATAGALWADRRPTDSTPTEGTPTDGSPADGLSTPQEQSGHTTAGLPRRVPRTSSYPGSNVPDFGVPSAAQPAPSGAGAPLLGAPAGGTAPQGVPHQDAGYQQQVPARRRSPEAARSRLSGFQLGGRDAVQAGQPAGRTSFAGEENSR
jgi:signal transduction histidine kinase